MAGFGPWMFRTNIKAFCVFHNIAMHHGFLLDINEDTLQDLRGRDAKLREPKSVDINTPAAAAAQVRRDQPVEEEKSAKVQAHLTFKENGRWH